jgi:hypothetical protein
VVSAIAITFVDITGAKARCRGVSNIRSDDLLEKAM